MALVGANVAVAKVLSESLPIALIAFLRCLLACLVLWPLARLRDGRGAAVPGPASLRNLALQALFGTAVYNAGLLAGLRLTGALEAGLVLSTLPAVVALGAAAWLREALPPRGWAAVALAVAGMGAITLARADGTGSGSVLGNALVFAGVCGEAIYVLLARRIAGQVPVLTAGLWMQLFSAAVLLPFALPGFGAALGTLGAAPGLLALLLFHSLTASVLCVVLWYAGLRRVPAGVAGLFTGFLPATAALVAVAALGEPVAAAHLAGFALMAASLLAAFSGRRR
jgi:drug/metabolite transporter (DMT)-like permease